MLEDGRRWGEVATDWQWDDANAVLEPATAWSTPALRRPGPVVAPRPSTPRRSPRWRSSSRCRPGVADLRPRRRQGPGAPRQRRCSPGSWRAVGSRGRSRSTGSRPRRAPGPQLEVLAADEASSLRPARPPVLRCDEVTLWRDKGVWVSIVCAVPKVAGCRLLALGTSGDPAHWSYDVRERARTSKAWRLSEVPGPLPWVTEEQLDEQRALLTDSQYRPLAPQPVDSGRRTGWCRSRTLRAAVTLDGPQEPRPGVTYRMGLDIGLTHDATACAVAHAEVDPSTDPPTRRIVLDRLVVLQGRPGQPVSDRAIEETVVALWRAYNRPSCAATRSTRRGWSQSLKGRGVSVEPWSVHRDALRADRQRPVRCLARPAHRPVPRRRPPRRAAQRAPGRDDPGAGTDPARPRDATTTAAWPSAWRRSRS